MVFLLLAIFFIHIQAASSDEHQILLLKRETMTLTVADGHRFVLAAPECTQFRFLCKMHKADVRAIELHDVDRESFKKLHRWVHIRKSSKTPFQVALTLLDEIDQKWHRPSVNALIQIIGVYVQPRSAREFAELFKRYISPESNCLPGGECDQIMANMKETLTALHEISFDCFGYDEKQVNGALAVLIAHELKPVQQQDAETKVVHCARLLGAPNILLIHCAQNSGQD